jgi:hypothetical protein
MATSNGGGWKTWVIKALFAIVLLLLTLAGNSYRKNVEINSAWIATQSVAYGERLATMEAKMEMMQATLNKMDKKLDDLK